jgi:pyruvate-formate lyase-activating enzyme
MSEGIDPHEMKAKLNRIGSGFCLAKWTQLTLNLQNGTAHSCHHPPVHKIPAEELKDNPSALHNTKHKKERRKQMLNGERPSECDFCWRIEDADKDALSDRHYKSAFSWSADQFDRIAYSDSTVDYQPSYVEVSFSHACNFKCMYCSPSISTSWMKEIKQHGAFPTTDRYNNIEWIEQTGKMPIPTREYNPYVEAFWKWWPSLYKSLHTFRITGGEPLMSKDTFRVMEWILETDSPNKNLLLGINSNFVVEPKLFERFINLTQQMLDSKRVRKFEIYTSAEASGVRAEYIRSGLDYQKFLSNIHRVCNLFGAREDFTLTFMCTYNALSLSTFTEWLKDLVEVRKRYGLYSIYIDVSYVRYPDMMDIKILPESFEKYIHESIAYMEEQEANGLMHKSETAKLKRIVSYWKSTRTFNQDTHQRNFKAYTAELDKRRNTLFSDVFPEYSAWYDTI